MVTLHESNSYTIEALKSFFDNTILSNEDDFYLIDNDDSIKNQFTKYNKLKVIKNKKKMTFSENVNQAIDFAIKKKKNLIFLSNDIIFTKNWFKPIASENDCISIPSNNQIFQYESDLGILKLKQTMSLNDFNENHNLLNDIVLEHKKKIKSGQKFQTLLMPFFCFKIPWQILKDVGNFDCSFGIGGGEDVDYRIRSELKGYSVNYLTDSYLLHFHGKSTWEIEKKETTDERNNKYKEIFEKKWGKDLTKIFILRKNFYQILEKSNLIEVYKNNNFSELINKIIF